VVFILVAGLERASRQPGGTLADAIE